MLIAEALKGSKRDDVSLSVKFGGLLEPSIRWLGFDARPVAVKIFLLSAATGGRTYRYLSAGSPGPECAD